MCHGETGKCKSNQSAYLSLKIGLVRGTASSNACILLWISRGILHVTDRIDAMNNSPITGNEIAGKITHKHLYEIAKIKSQDISNQASSMEEIVEKAMKAARSCGIAVVRHMDPEEYGKFLEERVKIIENQKEELQAKREAKLLRTG